MFWMAASVLAMLYCLVRGALDLRQKRYLWGVLGILSSIAVGTMPIQTHALKIDLPASN
jgi:hypothetical protein